MRTTVRIRGAEEVSRRLSTGLGEVDAVVRGVFLDAGDDAAASARSLSPVDTGEYRDSWRVDATDGLRVEVHNTAPHAPYVDPGFSAADVLDMDAVRAKAAREVARVLGAR
jgi:hypothetical protein